MIYILDIKAVLFNKRKMGNILECIKIEMSYLMKVGFTDGPFASILAVQ